jgi:hypothetical protein
MDTPANPVVKAPLKSSPRTLTTAKLPTTADSGWEEDLAQARQNYREICQESGFFRRHFSKSFRNEIEAAKEPLQKHFADYHLQRKFSRNEMHELELDKETDLALATPRNGNLTNADLQRLDKIRARYDQQIRQRAELVNSSITRAQLVSAEMSDFGSDCVLTAQK